MKNKKKNRNNQKDKEVLNKVYREFSRQKYKEHKLQFPKMRESEIVSKIINEWDSFDLVAKKSLQKFYEEKNYITLKEISSLEAEMKVEKVRKDALSASKNVILSTFISTEHPAPTKIISAEYSIQNDNEGKKNQIIQAINKNKQALDLQCEQKSKKKLKQSKSKEVSQAKVSYVNFFKFYYEKLSKEHRRWTATQISSVIKLMWRKRKNQLKTKRIQKTEDGRSRNAISNRCFVIRLYSQKSRNKKNPNRLPN